MVAYKSEAHSRIAELVVKHGPGWLEKRLHVADGTVRKWVAGATPQPRIRERAREVLGVPVEAWILPPTAGQPRQEGRNERPPGNKKRYQTPSGNNPLDAKAEPVAPADSHDPAANSIAVLRILRMHLETAERDEVATLANAITTSSRLLARLSGQLEITESQIVRSVPWRKAMGLLEQALGPYPQAARAVAEAFEGFGQ